MGDTSSEVDGNKLLHGQSETRVYDRRWFVLGTYAMFSGLQGWLWGLPGSIGDQYSAVYGVDGDTIQVRRWKMRA